MLSSCLREKEESIPEIKSPLEFIKQVKKKFNWVDSQNE